MFLVLNFRMSLSFDRKVCEISSVFDVNDEPRTSSGIKHLELTFFRLFPLLYNVPRREREREIELSSVSRGKFTVVNPAE